MHRFLEWHASQYMTENVITVAPAMTLYELGALSGRHDFNCFPVLEAGRKLAGMISRTDLTRALYTASILAS
jgi:CBS domain-containing protein